MYAPYLQNTWPFMRIVVRTKSGPSQTAAAIRKQVLDIDKDQPVDKITTMQAVLGSSFANRRFAMQLLSVFAVLALVLALVGVYGIVSYFVVQRMHEIGVRIALGAQRRDVLQLVLRHGMSLILLGVACGLAGSYALARLLTTLLFGVGAVDPVTFAAMALLMSAVAVLAAYIPARRATRVDPIAVLRFE
jgi:putative ABC transport system permease protein